MMRIAVIGGGAAGCFCAVQLGRMLGDSAAVTVYESGSRLMAKLAVTGGGRCNYTNTFESISDLRDAYPRGWQLMRRGLKVFSQEAVMAWFAAEGISPVIQEDCCVFPESQDAMHVVRVLEREMRRAGVRVLTGMAVRSIEAVQEGFRLALEPRRDASMPEDASEADVVVVTTGGGALSLLGGLDLEIESPVPSLFTFKIEDQSLRSLMGAVVGTSSLSLAGTQFRADGALLLTDWGVSGPATLRLSSYAARYLSEHQYRATLLVSWLSWSEEEAREWIGTAVSSSPRRQVSSVVPEGLTARLWRHILLRSGLRETMTWAELGSKGVNRLVSRLTADSYDIVGRCHFKEEFVTCGGVSLSAVSMSTLESRRYEGLYFAGEVLDVDAVTGGFNLQAAWTTAWMVATAVAKKANFAQ